MAKFRVGIIGCGNIFPMHSISVKQLPNAELAAVCDIKKERATAIAEEYNCSYYLDYHEMINKEKLDVVHICTPHYLHAPMALYAASKGVNILTEKPMSITKEDAYSMVEAAKRGNVCLGVIFQNRYNPGAALIKETLDTGQLGKIISVKLSVTWKRTDDYYDQSDWKGTWEKEGGGVIIDQAIHTFDLARWFVDSEIDFVDASIANRTHERIDVEDDAVGIIKYKNGVLTSFYTNNYYGYDAPVEIELHCENGLAKLTSDISVVKFNNGRELCANHDPQDFAGYGNVKSYWGISHIKQITNYYNALEKGIEPDITGEEALKTQELICAIYKSGKKHKRIKF